MKQIAITKDDSGQRLDKFMEKAFPALPRSLVYRGLRLKRIKLNGKRCQANDRLNVGDILSLYLNDDLLERKQEKSWTRTSGPVQVVYEDENLLLADKPAGLLCHEDDSEKADTLIGRVQHYLFEKGDYRPDDALSFAPALCNRIDRNTAGIVIVAKNAETLRILNEKIKQHELIKEYLLIVHGHLRPKSGTFRDWLKKDAASNTVSICPANAYGGKRAVTHYQVLKEKADFSLVTVRLETGRTHQIRVHFAFHGHPLLGDGKYGSQTRVGGKSFKSQCLYSYRLTFSFSTDAGALNYLKGKSFTVKNTWVEQEFGALPD